MTVDPCGPELLMELHDLQRVESDVADIAVLNVDLLRFRDVVEAAAARREVPANTWVYYRDFHLRHVLVADEPRTPTDRVRAYRAALEVQQFVQRHLHLHAA